MPSFFRSTLFGLGIFFTSGLIAQQLDWYRDYDYAFFIRAFDSDDMGNMYLLLDVSSEFDADPGPGISLLSPPAIGSMDAIISLDNDGNFRWVLTTDDLNVSQFFDLECEGDKFLISTIQPDTPEFFTDDQLDFDPCTIGMCGFTLQLTSNLEYVSHTYFLNQSSGNSQFKSLDYHPIIDRKGFVFSIAGITDIDPSASGTTITGDGWTYVAATYEDVELIWNSTIQMDATSGPSFENIQIHVTDDGGAIVTGKMQGKANIDGVAGDEIDTGAWIEGVAIRYDASGNLLWHFTIPLWVGFNGQSTDVTSMYERGADTFHWALSGYYESNFDPLGDEVLSTSSTSVSLRMAKYNTSGVLTGFNQITTSANLHPQNIELKGNGSAMVCYRYFGQTDYDPGAGEQLSPSTTGLVYQDILPSWDFGPFYGISADATGINFNSATLLTDECVATITAMSGETYLEPYSPNFTFSDPDISYLLTKHTTCFSDNGDGDGIGLPCDNCPLVANPAQSDFNSNGIGDHCEDSDNDGLLDAEEIDLGADPLLQDTDGDGITDWAEVNLSFTDPTNPDTDGDTCFDLEEYLGTCPNHCTGDLNFDGVVTTLDLLLMLPLFGATCE